MAIEPSTYIRTRNNREQLPAPWLPMDGDTRGHEGQVILRYKGRAHLCMIADASYITKQVEERARIFKAWMPIPRCD